MYFCHFHVDAGVFITQPKARRKAKLLHYKSSRSPKMAKRWCPPCLPLFFVSAVSYVLFYLKAYFHDIHLAVWSLRDEQGDEYDMLLERFASLPISADTQVR